MFFFQKSKRRNVNPEDYVFHNDADLDMLQSTVSFTKNVLWETWLTIVNNSISYTVDSLETINTLLCH